MFLKNVMKAASAFAVAALVSGAAMAIPVTSDGILNSGETDDYDSGTFKKNTPKNVVLTFTAGANANLVDISIGSLIVNPGQNPPPASFSLFELDFNDLTDPFLSQATVSLLPGAAGSFVFALIAGHNYEILVNVTSGNSTANPRFSYSVVVSAVPVPPALLLLGTGLLGAGALGRRRNKAKKISV